MEYTIITLFSVAIILFVVSLKIDRISAVEKQIEGFSISLMAEFYKLDKRIKLLEEDEILIEKDKQHLTEQSPNLQEQ